MTIALPLDQMTTREKFDLLELLWEDLSKRPEEIESPDWHREVLEELERKVESGEEKFTELEEAMRQVRKCCAL